MASYSKIFKNSHAIVECSEGLYYGSGILFEIGSFNIELLPQNQIMLLPSSIIKSLGFIIGKIYFMPILNWNDIFSLDWIAHVRIIGCVLNHKFLSWESITSLKNNLMDVYSLSLSIVFQHMISLQLIYANIKSAI